MGGGGEEHLMAADVTEAQTVPVLPSLSGEDEPRGHLSGVGARAQAQQSVRRRAAAGGAAGSSGTPAGHLPLLPETRPGPLAAGGGRAPAATGSGRLTLELLSSETSPRGVRGGGGPGHQAGVGVEGVCRSLTGGRRFRGVAD